MTNNYFKVCIPGPDAFFFFDNRNEAQFIQSRELAEECSKQYRGAFISLWQPVPGSQFIYDLVGHARRELNDRI